MAPQSSQKQRLWLDLTEHKPKFWKHPAFNKQISTTVSERLFFGGLCTSSATEKALPEVPERPAVAVKTEQGRQTYEKSLPDVPQGSSANGSIEQLKTSYVAFPVPPTLQPTAKTLPNPEARMTQSKTALREQRKLAFRKSLRNTGSTTSPRREDSDVLRDISSPKERSSQRAEHVVAVKRRDLTAYIASRKSKFNPGGIGEQCRRLLHNSLNLPGFHGSRTTYGVEFEGQSAKAESETHKNFNRRTAFRKSPSASLDGTNSLAYEHINTSPNLRAPPTPANPIVSDNEYCQCDKVDTITYDLSSTKTKSMAAAVPSRTSSMKHSSPNFLVITIDFKPTYPHIRSVKLSSPSGLVIADAVKSTLPETQLASPSPKVPSTEESTFLDADRIIIEVLRRIDARMAAQPKDDRMPVLKVTESLTKEVLRICKALTAGKPVHII